MSHQYVQQQKQSAGVRSSSSSSIPGMMLRKTPRHRPAIADQSGLKSSASVQVQCFEMLGIRTVIRDPKYRSVVNLKQDAVMHEYKAALTR